MTQPETEIRAAWRHIAGNHHDRYIDALLLRYAEPHRRYHTATHVMFVLRHLSDLSQAAGIQLSHELIAAALYHDAIYDPRVADNEALSAVLARRDLADIGWSVDGCGSVAALIEATAGHLSDDDASGSTNGAEGTDRAMLLDADLAILGADPGAYQAYANGVRAEYGHLDDDAWRAGRGAVLQRFLDHQRLFVTTYMYEAYEHRARGNIEAELAALGTE